MEDDWDLHAVVRGCSAASLAFTAAENPLPCGPNSSSFQQDYSFSSPTCLQDLFDPTGGSFLQELDDFYKPFLTKSQEPSLQTALSPQSFPISPLSVLGGLQDLSYEAQLQQQQQQRRVPLLKRVPQQRQLRQKQQLFAAANGAKATHNPTSRSKRRKTHSKRLCHVAAENLSSDPWSWRKYGQKPIKGSPYPRGYYRCSTSKGCMARKQVERDRSDPGMFMVTYTAEHNHPMPTHRNSLAGSTRHKTAEASKPDEHSKQSCSSEMPPETTHSPLPEKIDSSLEDLAEAENDEDEFSVSDMTLDDDFFVGLDDFTVRDAGDCMAGHLPRTCGSLGYLTLLPAPPAVVD